MQLHFRLAVLDLKKQLICNLNIKLKSICYLFLGKKPALT